MNKKPIVTCEIMYEDNNNKISILKKDVYSEKELYDLVFTQYYSSYIFFHNNPILKTLFRTMKLQSWVLNE